MKLSKAALITLISISIYSCSSEKESDLKPDCSESDLSLSVISNVNASCSKGGVITLEATGGEGGYQYSVDGVSFKQDVLFEDLSVGDYTFTVRDAAECTTTINGSVSAVDGSVDGEVADITDAGCNSSEGTVTLSASGGTGEYTYAVDGGEFQTETLFTALEAGTHSYTVLDGEGCTDSGNFEILSGVNLEAEIMPIIEVNCAVTGCHSNVQSPILTSKTAVIGSASSIRTRTSAGTMPPAGRDDLTQAQIDLIACWVEDGAPNN